MIIFKKIIIENFYSIEYLEYNFNNGIHKLSGANGNGKTSICAAIYQCLYNKNIKSTSSIDSTYNYITQKPYKITLKFTKDNKNYVICNDRGANKISISCDDKPVRIKGTKGQLRYINKLIGLDYDTFVSLSYLSQNSMNNIFDLKDTGNIIRKFFDMDILDNIEKKLKEFRRDYKKQKGFIEAQIKQTSRMIETLKGYEKEDIDEYLRLKQNKQESLTEYISGGTLEKIKSLSSIKENLQDKVNIISKPLTKYKTEYELLLKQFKQLETGICPLCNSKVTGITNKLKKQLNTLLDKVKEIEKEYETITSKLEKIKSKFNNLSNEYDSTVKTLRNAITSMENKILVIEEKNKQIDKIKEDQYNLEEQLKKQKETLQEFGDTLIFIESALGTISSGVIIKNYVQNFINVLNMQLKELTNNLDLPIEISVYENAGKLNYDISNNETVTEFVNLSSGERTRVSLIVLLAVVNTLEILTDTKLNYIVFDELLSVLDSKGVELFKTQLNRYRNDKDVIVVLHHNEIEDSYFDNILKVTKVNNLTNLEIKDGS